jgi:hypothetical protein
MRLTSMLIADMTAAVRTSRRENAVFERRMGELPESAGWCGHRD